MSTLQLIVFHYHLRPGGVTDVIVRATRALLQNSASVERVTIAVGSGEGVDRVSARLASAGGRASIEVIPELGYVEQDRIVAYAARAASGDAKRAGPRREERPCDITAATDARAERIVARLRRFVSDDAVWWIHNPHLGKNPAFTAALYRCLERFGDQRVVFHLHDFPEAGRYRNLRYLRRAGIERLYPRTPRLRYVCINTLDRDMLRAAGVTDAYYLRNPVEIERDAGTDRSATAVARAELRRRFVALGLPPADRVLLYPVRAIRRKNVLEAALIARLLPGENRLLVTLPGTSPAERAYSDVVDRAFAQGLAPGLTHAGSRLLDDEFGFVDLQRAVDAVVTSSVQEGFGYQFVSPMLFGTPLVARRLPVLADVQSLLTDHPKYIYDRFSVPAQTPSLADMRPALRMRYRERLDRLAPLLGGLRDRVAAEIDAALSGPTIEFSFLSVDAQVAVLEDALDPGFADRIRAHNPWPAGVTATLAQRGTGDAADRLAASFGPDAHARAVEAILADWPRPGLLSWADDAAVSVACIDPAHLRLLYT